MALKGIRIIEMAGLAPAPFCGMLLADFGASVVRVDRTGIDPNGDCLARGKRSISVNLKTKQGASIIKRLCSNADVLLDPFRAGAMEKLGLGPRTMLDLNPRLIYARLTGYGQTGKWNRAAGHDINYLAMSGVLSFLGRYKQKPTPPINLAADFAGGGITCAYGILLALLERHNTGKGQVIDSAMVDGAAYASTFLFASKASPIYGRSLWGEERGKNFLDSGAPFYDCYETSDGKFMSVGALEPNFYSQLLQGLDLDIDSQPPQNDRKYWPEMKEKFTKIFGSRTRDEWCNIFQNLDACVAPVLEDNEVGNWSINSERKVFFTNSDGKQMPSPAPRMHGKSNLPEHTKQELVCGLHTKEILLENGFESKEIEDLLQNDVVSQTTVKSSL
ncbi:Alpha-methylacyl-CoA racemase [Trichoplax sp. H2]|uniref:Alpha-methylacyl-CoA racemase n=1 Tax=Trichoplax adhaerens TaxID=10228 RepID=B3RSX4_TRIAD|nr:hypothetical protein TRIADDRAFT_54761 [Trichoplax adhaerens]EDV26599.1 hypothetical protein TRIADDRAFT_54761 [Trichoplax adhaerens]RDD45838.1 Alpha-methylacyl-CoA racemase [Trichoplax sp. H2]|eukprot:XP_002110595.1 hypothetical protein TRIADDRAFT_54761 [Trichoplax adhaerens]